MQSRIERAFLDSKLAIGGGNDMACDAVAVLWTTGQRFQNKKIEWASQDVFRHASNVPKKSRGSMMLSLLEVKGSQFGLSLEGGTALPSGAQRLSRWYRWYACRAWTCCPLLARLRSGSP